MPGDINSYDPVEDFESFLRATHFNKGVATFGDDVDESKAAKGGSIVFSGTAYVAGRKITGLSSDSGKPWVRCFLDTATAEEHAGPPPDPFPSNEEWYEKAQTAGNIHIPRA